MVSIYTLAQPRHPRTKYEKSRSIPPAVSKRVKNYVATERIATLAKAKHPKDLNEEQDDAFKVDKNAKLFKTSNIYLSVDLKIYFSYLIIHLNQLNA